MLATRVRSHVRSNIIGYICLGWLMAGTAVAATHLPTRSVGPRQLRRGAVTNRKLGRGAVTASKVKRGTLTGAKIKADSLTGDQILESSLGTVPRASNAGNAADAARLGGLAATSYQRRVTGTCSGGSAIRQVNGDGSVACQAGATGTITKVTAGTGLTGGGDSGEVTLATDPAVVQQRITNGCRGTAVEAIDQNGVASCAPQQLDAISETLPADHGVNYGPHGDIDISLSCGGADRFVRLVLFNVTGTPAVLNYTWNDGTTLHTSGVSLDNNANVLIDSTTGRIEGQFILAQLPDVGPPGTRRVTTLNAHAFNGGGGCELSGTTLKALG
jgi:hypothetical protein